MANHKRTHNTRLVAIIAALALVMGLLPVTAFASATTSADEKPVVSSEPAAESSDVGTKPVVTSEPAANQTQGEPQLLTGQSIAKSEDGGDGAAPITDNATVDATPSEASLEAQDVKDVYIDNTVDNSISYVIGQVKVTDAKTGEVTTQEVYRESAAATFSNAKTDAVQALIKEAQSAAGSYITEKGYLKTGEEEVAETAGKVWDNRKYETIEDGDAVLIGDAEYLSGAYGAGSADTRTHVASGDFGKETFYTVTYLAITCSHSSVTAHAAVAATCTEEGTEAYWECDKCGRLFSDKDAKTEISAPVKVAALGHDWGEWVEKDGKATRTCKRDVTHTETVDVSYSASSGDGATWTKGSSDPLTFAFKRNVNDAKTFKAFKGAQVDGVAVPESGMATAEGSLVLSLTTTYLETLSVGDHTLTVAFEDGEATATFTVKAAETKAASTDTSKSSTAKTGDTLPFAPIAGLAIMAALAAAVAWRLRRN